MGCPSCGFENRTTRQFCAECGARLVQTCPACRAVNQPGEKFCGACGASLAESAKPVPSSVGGLEGQHSHPGLRVQSPELRTYTPKYLAEKILTSRAALEGERKQVTVLFADVKGSMELAEQVDPEEWHKIIDRFFQILTDGVHRFEGTVNQYTGDGIMALFGAPIAHEDHARRACYTALHLRDELRRYADELRVSHCLSFFVRIGLNSGEVIVGKIGNDLRMDYTAQGHVVGLAQRMEQLAEPGCVCLTQHTAALVSGYFTLRDLGELSIKGVRDPLRVHALEGVGTVRTRLERAQARGLSRFVGRAHEMELLEVALAHAREGQGQVVGIVGAAGVGKSRLCLEFVERARAERIAVHQAHCPPHGKTIAFLPVLELLRGYFSIAERDAPEAAREKIAGRLLLLDEWFRDLLPVVFDFLNVGEAAHPAARSDPDTWQRQLFAFLRRLVQARSRREPGVLLLDDLHWIDPASDTFLAQLVEATAGTRTLLVANFRPEYHAEWMQKPSYQQFALHPLGPEAIAELLRELLGSDPSVGDLRERIRERTGGNPFFIEEVVLGLLEAGHLAGEKGAYRVVRAVDAIAIPASVQPVIAARIDRLAAREKEVLQAAAVIGKEFSDPVLRAVLSPPLKKGEEELAAALHALTGAEFIYEQELYPVAVYAFKHPLTQEVTYQSQLNERRARLHVGVARALTDLHVDQLDEKAALLAYHWEAAGEALEAARFHRRAADWVGRRNHGSAVAHWRKVRALADTVPESPESATLGLTARTRILDLGSLAGVLDAGEAEVLFAEGKAIAARCGDHGALVPLIVGYAFQRMNSGEVAGAFEHYQEARDAAERTEDAGLQLAVRSYLVDAHFFRGDVSGALALAEECIERSGGDPQLGSASLGLSPYLYCTAWRALLFLQMGRLVEAERQGERALDLCRQHGERETPLWVLGVLAQIAAAMGHGERALTRAREMQEQVEKTGTAFLLVMSCWASGQVHLDAGRWSEAVATLEQAVSTARQTRTFLQSEGWLLALLAQAYAGNGDLASARATAEEALAVAVHRRTPIDECLASLALARVLVQAEGARARTEIEAAVARGLALVEETGAALYKPRFHVERAELARLLGDETTYQRELREAHRLFVEMGATGHAERISCQLSAVGPQPEER